MCDAVVDDERRTRLNRGCWKVRPAVSRRPLKGDLSIAATLLIAFGLLAAVSAIRSTLRHR